MPTSTMNSRGKSEPEHGMLAESYHVDPSSRVVNQQLSRMVAVLKDKRMTISLMGRDRTNIILYLSALVAKYGLNISESYATRLQREHGSFFLITGPMKRLQSLARRLKSDRHKIIEGESIIPYKIFDLTLMVPDRVGLIHQICSTFQKRRFNIRTLWSFVYPEFEPELDGDDLVPPSPISHQAHSWWAFIQARVEVSQDGLQDMTRLKEELRNDLRSLYSKEGGRGTTSRDGGSPSRNHARTARHPCRLPGCSIG